MKLPYVLLKEFAKVTNDSVKKSTPTTLFGTVVAQGGQNFVKLDGSDQLTPVDECSEILHGDRVKVTIENHKAVVDGNFTASTEKRVAKSATTATDYIEETDDELNIYKVNNVTPGAKRFSLNEDGLCLFDVPIDEPEDSEEVDTRGWRKLAEFGRRIILGRHGITMEDEIPEQTISIGDYSFAHGQRSTAIGRFAIVKPTSEDGVAIGTETLVDDNAKQGLAIGPGAMSKKCRYGDKGQIAIGPNLSESDAQFMLGGKIGNGSRANLVKITCEDTAEPKIFVMGHATAIGTVTDYSGSNKSLRADISTYTPIVEVSLPRGVWELSGTVSIPGLSTSSGCSGAALYDVSGNKYLSVDRGLHNQNYTCWRSVNATFVNNTSSNKTVILQASSHSERTGVSGSLRVLRLL